MDIQSDFDNLINLLKSNLHNKYVNEIISSYEQLELQYPFSNEISVSDGNTKEHTLKTFEHRAKMEKERSSNPFVFGYEELLPCLKETKYTHVFISSIISELGTFIIFSNFEKTDFIGILKSKRTSTEIREKYSNHKAAVEQYGKEVLFDNEKNEQLFIKGKFLS